MRLAQLIHLPNFSVRCYSNFPLITIIGTAIMIIYTLNSLKVHILREKIMKLLLKQMKDTFKKLRNSFLLFKYFK